MIQALYIDSKTGPYPALLGPENCWDEVRDARNYKGTEPVICHSPCQLWVNFSALNYKRYGYPEHLRPGNDGGCFAHALHCVRTFGGVLEHPGSSYAWKAYNLKRPANKWGWGQADLYNGMVEYTCEVYQVMYGHKALKRTWLLYCGKQPPFELRWGKKSAQAQCGWFDKTKADGTVKKTLSKKEASRTPIEFAKEMIRLAEWSRG